MLLQIVALIALELGVHVLHKLPYIGPFAHPIMHFLTVSRTLDSKPALALAVASLVPALGASFHFTRFTCLSTDYGNSRHLAGLIIHCRETSAPRTASLPLQEAVPCVLLASSAPNC